MHVEALYISPVKSLAVNSVERVQVGKAGIVGDRAFFLIDDEGRLFTQRDHFPLVQVGAAYDAHEGHLSLSFPDGVVAGVVERGEPVTAPFWGGRPVSGRAVRGPWSDALSDFAGRKLRLVQPEPGQAFDGYPLSMCSMESLAALADAAGVERVDGRRFRQNVYVSGAAGPHAEDAWMGREVRIGGAVVRVKRQDARCVITTRSPDTGEHDLNTLKIIATYRTDDDTSNDVHFGVYCTIVEAGEISVGASVVPL
jgi:uncharacterized protein YcbX